MRIVKVVSIIVFAAAVAGAFGCSKRQVTRIATDTTIDLSGRWNDADSRRVSEGMIANCMSAPWKMSHIERAKKKPTVIVGIIRNKTSEHISIDTFVGDIERAFINSNEISVVASKEEREAIREERADQQTYSSDETVKQWGLELGADYMLGGTITSISDEEGGEKIVFYQVDLTLMDLQNNTKVWLGQEKIKKYIGRNKVTY